MRNQRGFLGDLIMIALIIGILFSVMLPAYQEYIEKAQQRAAQGEDVVVPPTPEELTNAISRTANQLVERANQRGEATPAPTPPQVNTPANYSPICIGNAVYLRSDANHSVAPKYVQYGGRLIPTECGSEPDYTSNYTAVCVDEVMYWRDHSSTMVPLYRDYAGRLVPQTCAQYEVEQERNRR
jgi:hypothetical protein